jgi:hypothetical protein
MAEDEEEFDLDDVDESTLPAGLRRELRKARKEAKETADLREQLVQQQRLLAFAQAGIDANDPAAKYFVKGYDGDMDPEAIKAAAVAARVITAGTPATEAEMAGHQAAQAAAAGGQPLSAEDEVARQLNEAGRIHWRDADQAQQEIMRIVEANELKLHVSG